MFEKKKGIDVILSNYVKSKNNKKSQKNKMAVNNAAFSKNAYKQSNTKKCKTVRNEKKNNAFSKFLIGLIIIGAFVMLVFCSGIFNIKEIVIENNKNISHQEILEFSKIQEGMNIFTISKDEVISNLNKNSYIESVQFKRCFPNTVKLIVEERKLDYVVPVESNYIYINRQGYILEISSDKPDVPMISGFTTDFSVVCPNDRMNENDLKKMNMVIKIMNIAENNNLKNLITGIDVSNEKNYTIYLDGEQKKAYLGDGQELNTRFLYIKSILKEQKGKKGEIFVNVDLNSEYVYFRENI